MKIKVNQIDSIDANWLGGGAGCEIHLKVDISERQIYDLFYQVWEHVGDQKLMEWFESEEYKLIPNQPSKEQAK